MNLQNYKKLARLTDANFLDNFLGTFSRRWEAKLAGLLYINPSERPPFSVSPLVRPLVRPRKPVKRVLFTVSGQTVEQTGGADGGGSFLFNPSENPFILPFEHIFLFNIPKPVAPKKKRLTKHASRFVKNVAMGE